MSIIGEKGAGKTALLDIIALIPLPQTIHLNFLFLLYLLLNPFVRHILDCFAVFLIFHFAQTKFVLTLQKYALP